MLFMDCMFSCGPYFCLTFFPLLASVVFFSYLLFFIASNVVINWVLQNVIQGPLIDSDSLVYLNLLAFPDYIRALRVCLSLAQRLVPSPFHLTCWRYTVDLARCVARRAALQLLYVTSCGQDFSKSSTDCVAGVATGWWKSRLTGYPGCGGVVRIGFGL